MDMGSVYLLIGIVIGGLVFAVVWPCVQIITRVLANRERNRRQQATQADARAAAAFEAEHASKLLTQSGYRLG
jgi:hypothetical protein